MRPSKIHFRWDRKKSPENQAAHALIKRFGQSPLKSAQHLVILGGDGTLLHNCRRAVDKDLMGVAVNGSDSVAFLMSRGISNPANLAKAFEDAATYRIRPLRADIQFADGSSVARYGYNDICIRMVHQPLSQKLKKQFDLSDIDVSFQSVSLDLKIAFSSGTTIQPKIKGGGVIFSTSLGSTAMNDKYHGPVLDIRNEAIILNGFGISEPRKGFSPIVNPPDMVFDVSVNSPKKRPVCVTFDSFGVVKNANGSPIASVRVTTANENAVNLLSTEDPGLKAYAAFMP